MLLGFNVLKLGFHIAILNFYVVIMFCRTQWILGGVPPRFWVTTRKTNFEVGLGFTVVELGSTLVGLGSTLRRLSSILVTVGPRTSRTGLRVFKYILRASRPRLLGFVVMALILGFVWDPLKIRISRPPKTYYKTRSN